MSRCEFTKAVKRAAYARSGGRCEGGGALYGIPSVKRCNADLRYGVEYDHIDMDANSKDAALENCACVCKRCHDFKTYKRDIPKAAKTLRQQDKHRGIRPKAKIPSRPFGWQPGNVKQLHEESEDAH